jgi:hypothetical protein
MYPQFLRGKRHGAAFQPIRRIEVPRQDAQKIASMDSGWIRLEMGLLLAWLPLALHDCVVFADKFGYFFFEEDEGAGRRSG